MKKSFTINSVSKSADGKRAQVTVPFGTGRNSRSVTRHIRLVGGKWVGFNPDERATPLNELYKQELAEAKNELAVAEAAFSKLLREREDIMNIESEGHAISDEKKAELEDALDVAEAAVMAVSNITADANMKLDIVQRELPLEVEFFGPGLTY